MAGNMMGRIFNNRYKISDRIGIGGMAEVYRAQDSVLGRVVAVKVMLPQYAADPAFTQRFRQEAAAAANLQSPYIVNVYDWGQDQGIYYIVMEYVRGSDLKTAIKERGAINQRKVAEIGSQVCQALSVAHNLDIIHRDIKPQNLMIQPDGNVKVMDFGIARAKNSVMTQTSSVLGTAHYVSPEQAQGKELTATSDIYSLGIVLYEAATGKLPFDGPDAVSVAMKQVNDLPVLPSEINPDIDIAFEDIIMKALEKDPTRRFATASEMKHVLNDYLAGRPVDLGAGFASTETSVMGGVPMSGAPIANGTAVMPAVGMGGTPSKPTNTTYRADDPQAKKKKRTPLIIGIIVAIIAIAGIAIGLTTCGTDQGISVPNVEGMTQADATTAIKTAGFELGAVSTVKDDTLEAGKVKSQTPKAGEKREKGTKIDLNVSGGANQVSVPDLANMTADEARKALDSAGLKGQAGTAEYSSSIAVNHIIKQDQAAGTKVTKDTVITYILSLGAESIDVPNIINYGETSAISTLEGAGFKVNITREYNSSVSEGLVISQNPTGKAEKGTTITITISQGAKPAPKISIPGVVGMTVADATAALQNAGFDVYVAAGDSKDIVAKQNPSGTAEKGTTITITATPTVTPGGGTGGGSTGGGTGGGGTTGGGTGGGGTTPTS
ncbi:MAG: Stk1 family PASTA domain-containing Ser/Thr kinase [Raoultibacter sp.]